MANFVPCDAIEEALELITIHTQTIGIYPESLKQKFRDKLAFMGGQRIVSIGYHTSLSTSLPHDALEPIRRLVRWVTDEDFTVDSFRGNPGFK